MEIYLLSIFKDAYYCNSGLDAGKWVTKKYKFDFKHDFYTEISSGESFFVDGNWKEKINDLKIGQK